MQCIHNTSITIPCMGSYVCAQLAVNYDETFSNYSRAPAVCNGISELQRYQRYVYIGRS